MTQRQLKDVFVFLLAATLCYGCVSTGVSPADRKKANASIDLAEAYLGEGKTSLAMRELVKAQKLNPDDAIIYNDFGLAYEKNKEYEQAIEHFKKALDINPDYAVAKNNLGSVYLKMERWDEAIPILEEVAGDIMYVTPHYPLANLGWAYYNKKDYKRAETNLNKALDLWPNFTIAQIHLGRVYLATGRLNKARTLFEKTAENFPKNPVVLYELGKTYRLLGKYNDSILALKVAIEFTDNSELAVKAAEELKKVYRQSN